MGMGSGCFGILTLFAVLALLAGSVTYHYLVNDNLVFERRDEKPLHINTNRSYRPASLTTE